jgi:Histone deacetylase domain
VVFVHFSEYRLLCISEWHLCCLCEDDNRSDQCGAGGGWCPYSDIFLAIRKVRQATCGRVRKVLVIDTDVHQGNGVERDKLHFDDQETSIVDIYNAGVMLFCSSSSCMLVVSALTQMITAALTFCRHLAKRWRRKVCHRLRAATAHRRKRPGVPESGLFRAGRGLCIEAS